MDSSSKPIHTIKAEQSLTLIAGDSDEPFQAQVDAFKRIRNVIFSALKGQDAPINDDTKIHIRRRVFTKVFCPYAYMQAHTDNHWQAKKGEKLVSVLNDRLDPTGKARKLMPDWIVTESLPVFVQHQNGSIMPCNHYRIRKGDFVDVIASVDIVQRPGRSELTVGLTLRQVVQLKGNALAVKVCHMYTRKDYAANSPTRPQPATASLSIVAPAKRPRQVVRMHGAFVQGQQNA